MASTKGAAALENVLLRTRSSNKYGTPYIGKQEKKGQKKIPLPPDLKYKQNGIGNKVYNHKKITTPIPTPYSLKTGARIQKDSTIKKIIKYRETNKPDNGSAIMRPI